MSEDTDRLIILTREQLLKRREAILNILGLTHKEYSLIIMNEGMVGSQWDYYNEFEAIEFLLGDERIQ